jgi:DNA-directed RNA polymerase subunit M/transcription elongation factor TFIIS
MDHDEYKQKFLSKCIVKIQNLKFDKIGIEKERIRSYHFSTKNTEDISYNLLLEAEKIDRKSAIEKIDKYLNNKMLSMDLERGLFEHVLIHSKKLQVHLFAPTYFHELYNICENLNESNESINNKTLCAAIKSGQIRSQIVPFLSPQQLHPDHWIFFGKKKAREDETIHHVGAYIDNENPCKNCGGIEFHSYEQQLRSADEPANKFITCIKCCFTVIF